MSFGISGNDARSGVEGFCPEVKKSKALDVTFGGTKVDCVELPQDFLTGFRIWYLRSGSLLCTMYFPTLAVVSTRKSTVIVESLACGGWRVVQLRGNTDTINLAYRDAAKVKSAGFRHARHASLRLCPLSEAANALLAKR